MPSDSRKKIRSGLARRRRKDVAFRLFGVAATATGLLFLAFFFLTLLAAGASAFQQTFMQIDVDLAEGVLWPEGETDLAYADYDAVVRRALQACFPDVTDRQARRELYRIVSVGAAYRLRELVASRPDLVDMRKTHLVPAPSIVFVMLGGAIVIAALCESAGALLAGGDVVSTISKGIIDPQSVAGSTVFIWAMMAALISSALWVNLATWVGAPVSTTHSVVGGVMGAGIAAAGFAAVNWPTMGAIAASWVI